jgi:hypothetical protein
MFSGAFRLDTPWLRRYIRETFSAGGELRQSVRHPAAQELSKTFGLCLALGTSLDERSSNAASDDCQM